MQSTYAITGLVMLLGLAGCASGLPHGKPVDYDNLPGENDSAKGPGLLSGNHYDASDGGGTLLYSDKTPEKSVFGSVRSHRSGSGQGQPASTASHGSAPDSARNSASSNSNFSDFKQFQEYEHFKQLPANSPEKQRFQTFQKWQEYKHWEQQK